MNENKQTTPSAWIDPNDAPEPTNEFFEQADEFISDKLVRRSRPKACSWKLALSVRYDADVVEAFKATGKGWQMRMNAALKDWLKTHTPA